MSALAGRLKKLAMEPPIRLFVRAFLKRLPVSSTTRALWDISDRPPYLAGVHYAARRALEERVGEIAVLEFGAAGGNGLLVLEREAAAVEEELGVQIRVYGFDNGPAGLPAFIGDHRDHPDKWKPGDFPMDEALLRSRLGRRTTLVLGNVAETVPRFFEDPGVPPVGFIAFDLDLYSSTSHALRILSQLGRRTLDHVPLYFDDTEHSISHRFAGELLAIDEFNGPAPTSRSTGGADSAAIGPSRRRRTCGRCTWPTTFGPSPRGPSTGVRCTARWRRRPAPVPGRGPSHPGRDSHVHQLAGLLSLPIR